MKLSRSFQFLELIIGAQNGYIQGYKMIKEVKKEIRKANDRGVPAA